MYVSLLYIFLSLSFSIYPPFIALFLSLSLSLSFWFVLFTLTANAPNTSITLFSEHRLYHCGTRRGRQTGILSQRSSTSIIKRHPLCVAWTCKYCSTLYALYTFTISHFHLYNNRYDSNIVQYCHFLYLISKYIYMFRPILFVNISFLLYFFCKIISFCFISFPNFFFFFWVLVSDSFVSVLGLCLYCCWLLLSHFLDTKCSTEYRNVAKWLNS